MAERFAFRHLGDTAPDPRLPAVGVADLDELIDIAVPESIRFEGLLDLPPALSEQEALAEIRAIASKNEVVRSMIGAGYHDTVTPAVILRNVLENPAWYTAYTPYQPEISQGRLEALLNFQTLVSDLTGFEVANASLLDEGSAAAEAMAMCLRLAKGESTRFLIADDCHPQTIAVVETRAEPVGVEVVVGPVETLSFEGAFGLLLQYPGTTGAIVDHRELVERAHEAGVLVVVAADPLGLTLLTPPGEWGADIAVGSTQRFGVPMGFGGPHAAYIATHEANVRLLPGRLVGVSVDSQGNPALRLALQTREQHIRRDRATSNVCTAQVLLAVMAGLYATWHGAEGLVAIAERVAGLADRLAASLKGAGFTVLHDTRFDTVTFGTDGRAATLAQAVLDAGFNVRVLDEDLLGVTIDETTSEGDLAVVLEALGGILVEKGPSGIPTALRRTSDFLTHPVFSAYRTEHEMLRYLRKLADKDLALDRTMIPLGSCTMKLNATTEMIPITWPEFARIHPFAPDGQVQGYMQLIGELESHLAEMTGYDAVSVQPNAGSQGELAGLLAIRAYHRSRGDHERVVCLIPSSAHGTNAASAVMAGMKVVVVACDDHGDVDLADLKEKAAQAGDSLAAIMVTYPSTHGVFEPGIVEICDIVHENGGQVYVDGANLNALVGLARPADFGADVSHLNLHKTFTIPHGGGGPGVGPVGVRSHLAPFLPGRGVGPVTSAPWGSAGILPIAWMYIRMMGASGLLDASRMALLNANYVASRLSEHYPVLYTGRRGRVAHECILDLRRISKTSGVTAEDVAKRLTDYGFHAPTLSFPVAGTLMVEPTESESLAELDRFCDAMIGIREEISRVEAGEWPRDDNPLCNAPHTAEMVAADEWLHPYPRSVAAFPVPRRYWPPVGRLDGAFGDRNLVCSCPPVESYS